MVKGFRARTRMLLILLIGLGWLQHGCAEGFNLSLKDAVLLSLRYNPNVQISELQRIIDKYNLRLAQNAFEVQYALTGSATYNRARTDGIISHSRTTIIIPQANLLTPIGTQISASWQDQRSGQGFNPTATFSIAQPLLRGFGRDIVQAPLLNQQDQEKINRLALKNSVMQTVTQVIINYRSLVSAKINWQTANLTLQRLQATVKQTEALIKAGRLAPSELVQAQAQVANQQLTLQAASNAIEQARLNLLSVIGLDPQLAIEIPIQIDIPKPLANNVEQSIDLALQNDINYQSALASLMILQRNLHVAKDNMRVQLNLNVATTVGSSNANAGWGGISNNNQTVGVSLNVPIDNVPLKVAVEQAKIAVDKQQIQVQALKRQIINNVVAAIHNLQTNYANSLQSLQALELTKQSLEIAKVKQRYGRISTFELLNYDQAYNASSIQMTANQINYLNDITNFEQVLGKTLTTWGIVIREQ